MSSGTAQHHEQGQALPPGERVYTLRALNASVQQAIADRMGNKSVWIEAEIAALQEHRSGHLFLELVDQREGQIRAKAQAVVWRSTAEQIRAELGAEAPSVLRAGNAIQCRVSVDYHVVYGLKLQLHAVNLAFNLGRMALEKKATLEALKKAGLMQRNGRLPMPMVPQRILVVGASDSAGMRDFVRQLLHNDYGFRFALDLAQTRVQGEGAGQAMAACVDGVRSSFEAPQNQPASPVPLPEVVVLVRGGGAQLDLEGYNHRSLAEAIARCPVPVITGIGHDSDQSVADLVAHTACKTPTAAAALLVDRAAHFEARQREILARIVQGALKRLKGENGRQSTRSEALEQRARLAANPEARRLVGSMQRLERQSTEALHRASRRLMQRGQSLKEESLILLREEAPKALRRWSTGLRREADAALVQAERKLDKVHTIPLLSQHRMERWQDGLERRAERLRLLDPQAVLAKGYALIERRTEHLGQEWGAGERIGIRLRDGQLDARVEAWTPKSEDKPKPKENP